MKAKRVKKAKPVTLKDRVARLESDVAQLLQIAYKGPPEAFGLAPIKREGGSTCYDPHAEALRTADALRGDRDQPCFIRVEFKPGQKRYTYRVRQYHGLNVGDLVIAHNAKATVVEVANVPPCYWLRLNDHKWITEKVSVVRI